MIPFFHAIRNLGRSPLRFALSVSGSLLVVLLVLTAAGFVRGMHEALSFPDPLHVNAIVMGAGSEESVERSEVSAALAELIAASVRGVRHVSDVPLVSPEIHVALPVRLSEEDAQERSAVLRGVRPVAFMVHGAVQLTEGSLPRPGRSEVVVGSAAAVQLGVPESRLEIGRTLFIDGETLSITGRFNSAGTVADGEIWLPLDDLRIMTRRESVSCIVVTPEDRAGFAALELFAATRPDLEISVLRESAYYGALLEFLRPVRMLVWITSMLIAAGGLLGGMNAAYAAFAGRVREIGMMQVLGFRRPAIVWALTQESLLTAAIGGLIACGIAIALIDGHAVRFTMGSFPIRIDAGACAIGLAAAFLTGLLGALPPAIRCLRLPVPEALKAH